MGPKALILIEGSKGNGPLYIEAAKRLGLLPVTLSVDPTQYDYLRAEAVKSIRIDTTNLDALIEACSRMSVTYGLAGITGFPGTDESLYVIVGELCRHFGLPGPNPESIERCCDKFVQRRLLAKAGIQMPAYRLARTALEVEAAAAAIGLPVIVKPAIGTGSAGVRLCRSDVELAKHTASLLGGTQVQQSPARILVEEFAEGPLYSVDTMGDAVIAVGVAEFSGLPQFVPYESMFPASLTDRELSNITDVSLRCLEALGLAWGPTNIEFRWTNRGPVLIEVNPRLPGWTNPRLIQLAYGFDLVKEHIKLVVGGKCDLRRTTSRVAAARFIVSDQDGILETIEGTSSAAAIPGVVDVRFYLPKNAPVIRKGDYRDMIGHVIAASATPAQTKAILQHAIDTIHWSVASPQLLADRNRQPPFSRTRGDDTR
ncbi:Phosphoribosylglycinamide synthetase ATP-grasp (A) domain protein [Neorhizobium galegae bv. officinalis]|uniref:Phosphoribosylglycinamide synthetase ATP-grasp (A) domain protein n=1 Tax=Neorhizobium galegae bv. officinalis TaxID=323656 RepID=A0A0T7G2K6_NEOGA|nr:ATP-grasp domain-containing protein [Neorhizobium galegae]CDZ41441.1 Phosphoribosylglycinamide synthetase ATP-grasp (A) domain protein [Neorhizobium galegae bv. officinalis]CDZ53439.1 Phosphoribosylglycinamide synthetase ATP-grasp (A) domain protein [Neorhizobium galegae bv. officinalis]